MNIRPLFLAFFACFSCQITTAQKPAAPVTEKPAPAAKSSPSDKSDAKPAEPTITDAAKPTSAETVTEKELLGLYLQPQTGALMEFQPQGKLGGWPQGGTWKLTGENQLQICSGQAPDGGEAERLNVRITKAIGGFFITREREGHEESSPLLRLEPATWTPEKWLGQCNIAVLVASEKTATKRSVTLDKDGYFRTPEGGYYLRILEQKKQLLAFASGAEDRTLAIQIYRAGRVLVAFNSLTAPKLLAVILLPRSGDEDAAAESQKSPEPKAIPERKKVEKETTERHQESGTDGPIGDPGKAGTAGSTGKAAAAAAVQNQQPKVVHLFVALCDNASQSIQKVPEKIGNGDDPARNLYWGCDDGVKGTFEKSPAWKRLHTAEKLSAEVLERRIYRHSSGTLLVADAYRGSEIKTCTIDCLNALAGAKTETYSWKDAEGTEHTVPLFGSADLIAYIGHNGLMDFSLESTPENADEKSRDAILLGCITGSYFKEILAKAGARPLVTTTGLMCPAAYVLRDSLEGWILGEDAAKLRERAAAAYAKGQKCGIKAARNLFAAP